MTSLPKRPIRRIACVGEVMIELIAGRDGAARLGVAGDTYNTAVYLARDLLGADVSVAYITALGTDPYSDRILSALTSHGIDAGHVERRPDKMPGLYAIDTDDEGERTFSYWRSDSAARSLFSAPCRIGLDTLDGFDMVYLSGITLAILPPAIRAALIAHVARFSEQGGTLAFDSNYRPRLWESVDTARQVSAELWGCTDIALPSIDDEMALFGDAGPDDVAPRLQAQGVRRGALKRGRQGPLGLPGTNSTQRFEPVTKVIDSTAAGDSFNAGYLAAIARGLPEDQAMMRGHALASRVVGHQGAIIPDTV
ncbi:sugar kinase [Chachezhania antarctica]|mgnify:CR=1 FL=1|uniref:sugar kinase n=1 Tax=Chachezhania antarctica TaxID=2340860 RepID=UPI001F08CD7D|nr:sugar kinase [Chachezhania antarctica]